MIQSLHSAIQSGKSADVLVVGAGIFGLWAARRALRSGRRVMVVEAERAGAGASGGFLGALMPHMPDRWNDKKQFQFEALASLEQAVAALEADTGIGCNYRRCGRLVPLRHENTVKQARLRVAGAARHWGDAFEMSVIGPELAGTVAEEWLGEASAPHGAQFDSLSARIEPRAYVDALCAYAKAEGTVKEGCEVVTLDPEGRRVRTRKGWIAAGEIVVAAGWRSYALLQPFMAAMAAEQGGAIGRGVKGQALLLAHAHDDSRPILYGDGAYVVPHAGGRVAIGSSTVEAWQGSGGAYDPADTAFAEKALRLAPWLRRATTVERWAAVRPRNQLRGRGTEPFMGPVPGHPGLSALIGGFKIGLGVAHMPCDRR